MQNIHCIRLYLQLEDGTHFRYFTLNDNLSNFDNAINQSKHNCMEFAIFYELLKFYSTNCLYIIKIYGLIQNSEIVWLRITKKSYSLKNIANHHSTYKHICFSFKFKSYGKNNNVGEKHHEARGLIVNIWWCILMDQIPIPHIYICV